MIFLQNKLQNAVRELFTLCCCLGSPRKDTSLCTQRRDAFHLLYDEAKYELKTLSLGISDLYKYQHTTAFLVLMIFKNLNVWI